MLGARKKSPSRSESPLERHLLHGCHWPLESSGTVPECAHAMSDTVIEASTMRKDMHPCDWCGKLASFSKECQKKL